jgi:hypothetical protein
MQSSGSSKADCVLDRPSPARLRCFGGRIQVDIAQWGDWASAGATLLAVGGAYYFPFRILKRQRELEQPILAASIDLVRLNGDIQWVDREEVGLGELWVRVRVSHEKGTTRAEGVEVRLRAIFENLNEVLCPQQPFKVGNLNCATENVSPGDDAWFDIFYIVAEAGKAPRSFIVTVGRGELPLWSEIRREIENTGAQPRFVEKDGYELHPNRQYTFVFVVTAMNSLARCYRVSMSFGDSAVTDVHSAALRRTISISAVSEVPMGSARRREFLET